MPATDKFTPVEIPGAALPWRARVIRYGMPVHLTRPVKTIATAIRLAQEWAVKHPVGGAS